MTQQQAQQQSQQQGQQQSQQQGQQRSQQQGQQQEQQEQVAQHHTAAGTALEYCSSTGCWQHNTPSGTGSVRRSKDTGGAGVLLGPGPALIFTLCCVVPCCAVLLQYRHYEACLQIFQLNPTQDSKEFAEFITFIAQVCVTNTVTHVTHIMTVTCRLSS
jgi:hypothetical protein